MKLALVWKWKQVQYAIGLKPGAGPSGKLPKHKELAPPSLEIAAELLLMVKALEVGMMWQNEGGSGAHIIGQIGHGY